MNFIANEYIVGVIITILVNPIYDINLGNLISSLVLLFPFISGQFISLEWKEIIHDDSLKVRFIRDVLRITKVFIHCFCVELNLVCNFRFLCLINWNMLNYFLGKKLPLSVSIQWHNADPFWWDTPNHLPIQGLCIASDFFQNHNRS